MQYLQTVLACAQSGADGASDFFTQYGSLIFMVVLMVGLIVLMIVPQRKREKKIKEMLDSIRPGDRVRTIGGIFGTVVSVKEDVVTISVGPDKARLVFARGAIATIENRADSNVENTMQDGIEQ